MGRKGGSSVLKRQREMKKAERAALRKEQAAQKGDGDTAPDGEAGGGSGSGSQVASDDDLAGYGFPVGDDAEEDTKD